MQYGSVEDGLIGLGFYRGGGTGWRSLGHSRSGNSPGRSYQCSGRIGIGIVTR